MSINLARATNAILFFFKNNPGTLNKSADVIQDMNGMYYRKSVIRYAQTCNQVYSEDIPIPTIEEITQDILTKIKGAHLTTYTANSVQDLDDIWYRKQIIRAALTNKV